MKKHAGSTGSKTNREKRIDAKIAGREKEIRRINNVLTKNTSLAERARRRGDATAV